MVETEWADAVRAVEQVQPAAVLAATSGHRCSRRWRQLASADRGTPALSAADRGRSARSALPDNAIPLFQAAGQARLRPPGGPPARRAARAVAACDCDAPAGAGQRRWRCRDIDPARDATVLLIGRGGAYPALSVALGERTGVVGALSIEAAAKHLNARDIDGIVLGEGFSPRVIDAFLDRADGGRPFPQPARRRDVERSGA